MSVRSPVVRAGFADAVPPVGPAPQEVPVLHAAVRSAVLVALAVMLVFVLLPALLGAASHGM